MAGEAGRRLGDEEVFPIGLGCMPMSTRRDRDESRSVRTIHAALDAGVRLFDTADAYAWNESELGHNERLLARALASHPAGGEALVATKGGHVRRGEAWDLDGRPEHLRQACEASLARLHVDAIGLYQLHRPDPAVPYAESLGALRDLRVEGKIRYAGISNAHVAQIAEARRIAGVAAVQNELSLDYTAPIPKGEVAACDDEGLAFLAWSPLGGVGAARDAAPGYAAVVAAAERHSVSPQRVALAWLLSLGPSVMPIPGASRPETALDSIAAAELRLEPEEVAAISAEAGLA